MKIKTSELQDVVSKIAKGVGNNKLIPLTSLVNISVAHDYLLCTVTDASNYFTISVSVPTQDEFDVSVNADTFIKLVQKMTSQEIGLTITDNYLYVTGNGKYKLDLVLDEEGNPVTFESEEFDRSNPKTVKLADVKKALANNKNSLASGTEIPCLQNYYIGEESVVTTDRFKICETQLALLGVPQLLSPATVELLALFPGEEVDCYITDTTVIFDCVGACLYAQKVPNIDKFPVDAIQNLVKMDMPYECTVNKPNLLAVLDRLTIFVGPYDKNTVYLTFVADGVDITSKRSNGSEHIDYATDSKQEARYTCALDIEMLKSQIATVATENVTIKFGSDVAIAIIEADSKKIVALSEDDRVDGE